ncbi:MAG: hypothetical protein WDA27_10555 [Actinomycetota bacterium]
MLFLIAVILIVLTAVVAVSDATGPDAATRHRPTTNHLKDETQDGFEARRVFTEPPDVVIVGYGAPHLRPDPDRLIQTEVIVRDPPMARLAATIRLGLIVFFFGAVFGFTLIVIGMGLGRLLRRYAGA